MSQANNVVAFPERKHSVAMERVEFIETMMTRTSDIADEVMTYLEAAAEEEGFDITADEHSLLNLMIYESIKALLLQTQHIEHPVASFAKDVFNLAGTDD